MSSTGEQNAEMDNSRTHLTALPPGFITVRIMQMLFNVPVLALAIFVLVVKGEFTQLVVTILAGLSLVVLIWIILATYKMFRLYNYWAVLSMEILFFIVWLVAFIFALGSSFSAYDYQYSSSFCSSTYNYTTHSYTSDCEEPPPLSEAAAVASIISATFAACLMILWLVSMIVISVFIARHRDSGGHNKPGSAPPVPRLDRPLMAQTQIELQQQNLALQQQYIMLQQQHLDLQRATGLAPPPQAMMGYGQQNVSRGQDLERGYGGGAHQGNIGMASPMGMPQHGFQQQGHGQQYPQMQQMHAVSPVSTSAGHQYPQQQQAPEMAEMSGGKGKGKGRQVEEDDEEEQQDGPVMSGRHQDEITEAPMAK